MKKPTCETCVYWDIFKGDYSTYNIQILTQTPGNDEILGICMRRPPSEARFFLGQHMWFGEHPDFPRYLESIKDAPDK